MRNTVSTLSIIENITNGTLLIVHSSPTMNSVETNSVRWDAPHARQTATCALVRAPTRPKTAEWQ